MTSLRSGVKMGLVKKLLSKYPNTIIILFITLLILFFVGKRSYNTKILPFQSITLNCVMDGKQLFPKDGGAELAPIVKFPRVFKIKFGYTIVKTWLSTTTTESMILLHCQQVVLNT